MNYDFGARHYDPELGRWFVQDPLQQFYSAYVYAANNPVNIIDPSGMWAISEWISSSDLDDSVLPSSGASEKKRQDDAKKNGNNVIKALTDAMEYLNEEDGDDSEGGEDEDTQSGGGIKEWWNNIDWQALSNDADDFFIVASIFDAQLPIGDSIGLLAISSARIRKLVFGVNKYARIFYKANPRFKKLIGRGLMEIHQRIPQKFMNSGLFPESMRTSLSNLYGLPRGVHQIILTPA